MLYKNYAFKNVSRGFGNALDVVQPDGNKSQWCTAAAGDSQSSVKSPISYVEEIDPEGSRNGRKQADTADAIIDRIESGEVRIDNRNETFLHLNRI